MRDIFIAYFVPTWGIDENQWSGPVLLSLLKQGGIQALLVLIGWIKKAFCQEGKSRSCRRQVWTQKENGAGSMIDGIQVYSF